MCRSAMSLIAGEEHPSPVANPPAVKKPVAAREEHPPPAVNAPVVKELAAAGEGHSVVKQLGHWEEASGGASRWNRGAACEAECSVWLLASMASLALETVSRLGEKKPPPFPCPNRRLQKQSSPFPRLICRRITK
ncbi:hypothetical protein GW17_00011923 [Ensete ventricosum]|nr:hypothetical protein GW17_00011923 [Ensete ventricosum]